jgi:hypothetical protein
LCPLTAAEPDGPRGNIRMPTVACPENQTSVVWSGALGLGYGVAKSLVAEGWAGASILRVSEIIG